MSSFAWTDREVRTALALPLEGADDAPTYVGISTDSRSVRPGELFVALVGDRFDAHDFVADAVARGAAGVVVSRLTATDAGVRTYPVQDTLVALGALARYRRWALKARVVGITGSSGKTTTKELTRAALAGRYRVHATLGNLNNRVGLPLTLLAAPEDAEVVVAELGSNEPGEIGVLTEIAAPQLGVVTSVGETHLEKLGSLEGVLDEKLDLLRGLPPDGHAVVGDEPPELPAAAREVFPRTRVAGWSDEADPDLRPADARPDEGGAFSFRWKGETVTLRLPGRHAVQNALLALAVSELLDVPAEVAARGLESVTATGMRGEIRRLGSLTVLVDCYNANPQSVRAALDLLAILPAAGARVAVLGSMLELGRDSDRLHRRVLADSLDTPVDLVVATGSFAAAATERPDDAGRLLAVADPLEAYAALRPRLKGDETLLLKGSRGVALERLLPLLEGDFAALDGPRGGQRREDSGAVAGKGEG